MNIRVLNIGDVNVAALNIGGLNIGDLNAGQTNIGALTFVVVLLVVAAVLVWPSGFLSGGYSLRGVVPGRLRAGAAGDDHASAASTAVKGDIGNVGDIRRVVPVAEVAGVIDLLALTLRGGAGLVEAMEAVAVRVGGPLGLHLQTVAAAGRWGVEDATAWASVPSAWQPAARALRMAVIAGVPPADALVSAADGVRRDEQQRLEVSTATLGIRIVLPLGLLFLPAFILTTVVPIVLALAQQVLASQ